MFSYCSGAMSMRTLTVRGYAALIALVAIVTLVGLAAGAARAEKSTEQEAAVTRHALGTFEVEMTPADPEAVEAGLGLSRYTLTKTFSGGLTGQGTGQMLTGGPGGVQDTGTYIALERVVGTLDGKEGAFLLAHRGDMGPEGFSLSITVVPNSGTGALAGIAGVFSLTIADGQHKYDLAYTLPE